MEAQMLEIPSQSCPPGFRQPPLQLAFPLPSIFPPGFRPPSVYNETLPSQSCPPGFRPSIQHVESSTIMQSETKSRSRDSITFRPEFRLGDQPEFCHDAMRGSLMYGAADRHGWYLNEGSAGVGRVCESLFVDCLGYKPYVLSQKPLDGGLPNLYRGAALENENWRREKLLHHGRSLTSPVPVSNIAPPVASYAESFWPGRILASSREAGKRRSSEGSEDNTSPTFKCRRTGHEMGSPSWARYWRESEMPWPNGLRVTGDRVCDCEASHIFPLHTEEQTECGNKTDSSIGTVDCWHDRQESRIRRGALYYQNGSLSFCDRNQAPINLESQSSELRSRPSSFRPISQSDQSDRSSLRGPFYSNGKKTHCRNNPCFDVRNMPSNSESWSPRPSLLSRSPSRRSNYALRVGQCSLRRDSWPPKLLAGKSSSGTLTDKHVALWRSADGPGKAESNAEGNETLTTLRSSRVGDEHAKCDRSRSDHQVPDVVAKQKSPQCFAEGNVAQTASNKMDKMALALTDRIKNEEAFSFPVRAGSKRKLFEMKPKAEQCGSPEKNLPLQRNSTQFSNEKASLSVAKLTDEYQSASSSPISATSLKTSRYITNIRSAPKYYASQDSEVDWKISPVKVTRRQRNVIVSAGPPPAEISGSDEGGALPAEEQDEAEGGVILRVKNTSKSLLGPLLLERSSIAFGANEGLIILFVGLSGSQVNSYNNEKAVKKWIFTGVRSKHLPSVKSLTTSGSNLQSPKSVGKSQTPGGCLLAEDAPGRLCSQQMEEALPISSVKSGRGSCRAGFKKPSDQSSVCRTELSSLDKDQEFCTPGIFKYEVASLKDSATVPETQKQKLSLMVEKPFVQESPVHDQNLERDHVVISGTEGQLRSPCRPFAGYVTVNPVLGKSGSLFDDWLFGFTLSIPLAMKTNERSQPNCSTLDSPNVFVKSELQDPLCAGDKEAEQLFGEKTATVIELARVMTDTKKAAFVQEVVSQPSDLRDASARDGEFLATRLEDMGQGESLTKLASFLTNAGTSADTGGSEVMNILPLRSDSQETNPGENARLVRVTTGEGGAGLTDSENDFEVISETSREVVTTFLHFDRELGKRCKILHSEKRGNLKQVLIADDPIAKVLESSSSTGKVKADSILMKKRMPSLKGGIQRIAPVLKKIDTAPLSSHLSVPPAVTPPSRGVGCSYSSNKTWRREATPVNSQQFSSTLQKPAQVALPSTYVRKNFSIIRYPAPQVPLQSNVGAQPNALSKFSQGSVTQSRNKNYSLSASMGHQHVDITVAKTAVTVAAAASPCVKTLNAKISELGTMLSKGTSPSPVRSHSIGDDTLVTDSQSILSDLNRVSKISSSKPAHCEGSTLVCVPASKSPGRATNEAGGYVVSGTRLFRKRKSGQVHVGPPTTTALRPSLEKCNVPLGYMKWKTNQLVRCDHPEASAKGALQNVVVGGDHVKFMTRQRKNSAQLKTKTKAKLDRVLSPKRAELFARLGFGPSVMRAHTIDASGTSRDWQNPLFPWKKSDIVARRLRRGRSLHEGKMGSLFLYITNQSQKYRSAHPVYTRSAYGFSLHRSGVLSKSDATLKTQSTLPSETATKVVAEAENTKNDKEAFVMAVAKARNEQRAMPISGFVDPSSTSSLSSLGIGGVGYVRKGFGNQLVRSSKTVARVVASEKFRWSLRNARLRRAKKQAFCAYYTRFGMCKRGDGKCHYIHDPDKVAVCTKFLRSSCSDPACRLTHEVIPERLSDCLYFVEGLCTNERCPYRHVNINKEAPICDAFLQGYCAEGDKCKKKHTYVCPEYTLTERCSSSNCKLRHLKKTKQPTAATEDSVDSEIEAQKSSKRELQRGRYFTLTAPVEGNRQGQPVPTGNAVGDKIADSVDDQLDFISIDEYDSESTEQYQDTGTV